MLVALENRRPEHASPRAGAERNDALPHNGATPVLQVASLFLHVRSTAREKGGMQAHPGGAKAQRHETVVEALHTVVPACQKDEHWEHRSRDENWARLSAQRESTAEPGSAGPALKKC